MQADFIQKLGIKAGCRGRGCGRGPLGGARPSSYFPAFWSLAWRRTAQVGGDIRDPHIAQMDRTAYQVPGHQLVHELFHLREREVLTLAYKTLIHHHAIQVTLPTLPLLADGVHDSPLHEAFSYSFRRGVLGS